MERTQPHILIVDDEVLNLDIISEYLSDSNYLISTAHNGTEAWKMLESTPDEYDVILLDRMMPGMNGMDLLEKIKQHTVLQHYPVIFQTAKASVADIAEGMNAGAYYYLTKPFEEEVLLSVVKTAVNDRLRFKEVQNNLEKTQLTMGLLKSAEFDFQSPDEARSIASLISNACPKPDSVVMGLTELMINAVEHGNLGISYADKSELNSQGTWAEEVTQRLALEENKTKYATIHFINLEEFIEITVTDQGDGFNWKTYMDFDPNRVMDNHGRGIAIANQLSFHSVEYKGKGNQVTARIKL